MKHRDFALPKLVTRLIPKTRSPLLSPWLPWLPSPRLLLSPWLPSPPIPSHPLFTKPKKNVQSPEVFKRKRKGAPPRKRRASYSPTKHSAPSTNTVVIGEEREWTREDEEDAHILADMLRARSPSSQGPVNKRRKKKKKGAERGAKTQKRGDEVTRELPQDSAKKEKTKGKPESTIQTRGPNSSSTIVEELNRQSLMIDEAVSSRRQLTDYFDALLAKAYDREEAQQQLMYRWGKGMLPTIRNQADRAEQTITILLHLLVYDLPSPIARQGEEIAHKIVRHVWDRCYRTREHCHAFYVSVILTFLSQFVPSHLAKVRIMPFKHRKKSLKWCQVEYWTRTHVIVRCPRQNKIIGQVHANLFFLHVANGIHCLQYQKNMPLFMRPPLQPWDVAIFDFREMLEDMDKILEEEEECRWLGHPISPPLPL